MELAAAHAIVHLKRSQNSPSEGNFSAMGQSRIEKMLQVPEFNDLAECLAEGTERAGFEPAERSINHSTV